jgi:3-dehydroquinate dehydratase-2
MAKNILLLNGPNLNLLGSREPEVYGSATLKDVEQAAVAQAATAGARMTCFQSNHEGELIDKIQLAHKSFNGLIINPGGFSHTTIAIRDALELCTIPKVEVHISNLATRETFRHTMLTASSCDGYISGFREKSYLAALYLLEKILS